MRPPKGERFGKQTVFVLITLLIAAAIAYTFPSPSIRRAAPPRATGAPAAFFSTSQPENDDVAIAYIGTTPVTAGEWKQGRAAAEVMMRLLAPPDSTLDESVALEGYLEDRLIAEEATRAGFVLEEKTVLAEERRILSVADRTPEDLQNILTAVGLDQQAWREELRQSVLASVYLEDVIMADTPPQQKEQKRSQWLAALHDRYPVRTVETGALREGLRPGSLAPDFALTGLDGEQHRLSEYRGKAVILNFWASWCLPCREEMPLFEQFYSRQKDELTILGVDLGEDRATVQAFIDELGITFPILLDQDQAVTQTYRVYGIPTSFFLDKNGVIRDVVIGRVPDEETLKARLEGILPAQ